MYTYVRGKLADLWGRSTYAGSGSCHFRTCHVNRHGRGAKSGTTNRLSATNEDWTNNGMILRPGTNGVAEEIFLRPGLRENNKL